ncbi:hypothetical protein Syun_003553 [Stephania yunnanensis]|uniref:Uncharacterized protein n=1 Tax=Stephania yunnanensis TaxID=152371 RepID=A0AAP0L1I0_9MAGN
MKIIGLCHEPSRFGSVELNPIRPAGQAKRRSRLLLSQWHAATPNFIESSTSRTGKEKIGDYS